MRARHLSEHLLSHAGRHRISQFLAVIKLKRDAAGSCARLFSGLGHVI